MYFYFQYEIRLNYSIKYIFQVSKYQSDFQILNHIIF